jgi:hypothetical protein
MQAANAESPDTIFCAIVDYGQNMDMPFFGSEQPGDTYYCTPKTVKNLGIVDVAPAKDILYTYVYCEHEGSKGGNNVTSLLHRYIDTKYGFDARNPKKKLSIVMDNCSGQNKNNTVLHFLSWLVEQAYFEEMQFAFFVVGHTKNVANRLFNILKILYRNLNIFSMKMLIAALNTADQPISESVTHEVFKDYDKMLDRIYKDLDSVKKWQIFKSSKALGPGKIEFSSSNLEGAKCEAFDIRRKSYMKRTTEAEKEAGNKRKHRKVSISEEERLLLLHTVEPKMLPRPGLRGIKQIEFYTNYRKLVPDEF